MQTLLKKLFIHLLDVQSFLNLATNTVANHQAGELVAFDEQDSLAQ
jgi:hypothetical protein